MKKKATVTARKTRELNLWGIATRRGRIRNDIFVPTRKLATEYCKQHETPVKVRVVAV